MWNNLLAGFLGISKQAFVFVKDVAVPFIRANWPLIISLWPTAQQFIKTASTKEMTDQEKQDYVVSLLRKEAVDRGLVTKQEDASTSTLQLVTLLAYRTLFKKDV